MKASRYNIWVRDPESGRAIIFNSLYGSVAAVDPEERGLVEAILKNPDDAKSSRSPPLRDTLIKQKFLIDDQLDELGVVRARKRAGVDDTNQLDLILLPTLECNFSCAYCYEDRRPSRMTGAVQHAIRRWMADEIPKHKILLLSWFGGEPVLGIDTIVALTRHAKECCQQAGVAFIGHITTNGYLLNSDRAQTLVHLGLLDYQITLDGSRETHDRLRVLHNGRGTFEQIHRNIINLLQLDHRVKVTIRVNFNSTNLGSVPTLLDSFPAEHRGRLRVALEPIFGDCTVCATPNLVSDETARTLVDYMALARRMGFDVVRGSTSIAAGKLVYCYAERKSQFLINYNGDVFKCSVSKFAPEERVGYLDEQGRLIKIENRWGQFVNEDYFEERCLACAYLPVCMGGCRMQRAIKKTTGANCCLIPANSHYLLKQIALGGLNNAIANAVADTP
jgi:uncharacterized protein